MTPSTLKDHQATMLTGVAAELEQLNQTVAAQKAELARVYEQLKTFQEWRRHMQRIISTPIPGIDDASEASPTLSMPALGSPAEFAPASSQPSGPMRHVSPLSNGHGKNPLADSFVL